MTTTVNRLLLNSAREDAKLVLKWADLAASRGGSFSVVNEYSDGNWVSIVTINWPEECGSADQAT